MGLCNKLCEKVLGHINDHYWAILGHINDINCQNFRLAYAPVHTNPFSFENAYFCMRFRRSMENGYLDARKRSLSKMPSKVETFENGCLSYQCGRAKTKVFSHGERKRIVFSCGRSKTIRKRQCGRGYLYPFSLDQKRRHTKTDQCGRSLSIATGHAMQIYNCFNCPRQL